MGSEEEVPVGLVVTLVLAFAVIAVLVALLCCSKRKKKQEEASANARSVDAPCKVVSPGDVYAEGNKLYDVDLDDNVSKGSVDTEDSDGVTYFVEGGDIE